MNKQKLILPISIIIGCVILGSFYYSTEIKVSNEPMIIPISQENSEVVKNSIDVEKIFYIGCSNGQCVIPKASGLPMDEQMICIWNYTCGNGSIPQISQTRGWLPSIDNWSGCWDLSVLCRDSNGVIYFGEEGEAR